MSKSTKIRLDPHRFAQLTYAQQLQALHKLIDSRKGPLRIREKVLGDGQKILYLGTRTWSQYFWEKLVLFPAEKERRRQATRNAIDKCIKPALKTNKGNAYNVDLIDKLHYRVYKPSIRGSSYYQGKPKEIKDTKIGSNPYRFDSRTAIAGVTNVPRGVTIARIAPTKVMADVRIMVREVETESSPFFGACQNIVSESYIDVDSLHQRNLDTLVKHYKKQLQSEEINSSCRSIVLELVSNDRDHWKAAYSAANSLVKEASTKSQAPPSIMLVPRSDETGEIQGQEMTHDQWLTEIAEYLKDVASTSKNIAMAASSHIQKDAPSKAKKKKRHISQAVHMDGASDDE